jgi:phosphoenolpyruvate-protein kinase (PTS system EI component)
MVTEYFIDDHPAVLRLIELVVRESGDAPVSLCGELAGRIDVVLSLLRTGSGLSVCPLHWFRT